MDERGGGRGRGDGVSRFFVKSFLSHTAEKFRRGTLWCVTNSGYRKISCLRGLCQDFLSNFFCLTVPKKFVGESFSVSENFWYRKILWMRGGGGWGGRRQGVSKNSVEFYLSHSAKNFVDEPFGVSLISSIEKG